MKQNLLATPQAAITVVRPSNSPRSGGPLAIGCTFCGMASDTGETGKGCGLFSLGVSLYQMEELQS